MRWPRARRRPRGGPPPARRPARAASGARSVFRRQQGHRRLHTEHGDRHLQLELLRERLVAPLDRVARREAVLQRTGVPPRRGAAAAVVPAERLHERADRHAGAPGRQRRVHPVPDHGRGPRAAGAARDHRPGRHPERGRSQEGPAARGWRAFQPDAVPGVRRHDRRPAQEPRLSLRRRAAELRRQRRRAPRRGDARGRARALHARRGRGDRGHRKSGYGNGAAHAVREAERPVPPGPAVSDAAGPLRHGALPLGQRGARRHGAPPRPGRLDRARAGAATRRAPPSRSSGRGLRYGGLLPRPEWVDLLRLPRRGPDARPHGAALEARRGRADRLEPPRQRVPRPPGRLDVGHPQLRCRPDAAAAVLPIPASCRERRHVRRAALGVQGVHAPGGGRQPRRHLNARRNIPVTVGYGFSYGRTTAQPAVFCSVFRVCDAQDRALLESSRRFAAVTISGVRDQVNNVLDPSGGSLVTVTVMHASRLVYSDTLYEFNRGELEASRYYALGRRGVFAWRVRAGAIVLGRITLAGQSVHFVPPDQRFYGGGPNSVRGYARNELGPRVYVTDSVDVNGSGDSTFLHVTASPTGGNTIFVANTEVRFATPLFPDRMRVALFVDAGQVWERGEPLTTVNGLRVTPGVGLRFATPLGPVRLDAAYNGYPAEAGPVYLLNNTDKNLTLIPGAPFRPALPPGFWRRIVWQFAVGQAF